ncbi:MAG: translation initiation factor IF-3 [Elusimicrobiota bacterium]|nr:translation initiation factor IF-3 [Elusimicrobiota bacterium]
MESKGIKVRVNENIRAPQVRLTDENGTQIGIKTLQEALKIAASRGLDLVEIAPEANPPVCKIVDYSKYKYEQERRLKEQRKRQRIAYIKEIRLRPKITDHDLEFKVKHAIEFIEKKHKVKFSVMLIGREMTHTDLATELLNKIKEKLAEIATLDFEPKFEKNKIVALFSPKHR